MKTTEEEDLREATEEHNQDQPEHEPQEPQETEPSRKERILISIKEWEDLVDELEVLLKKVAVLLLSILGLLTLGILASIHLVIAVKDLWKLLH